MVTSRGVQTYGSDARDSETWSDLRDSCVIVTNSVVKDDSPPLKMILPPLPIVSPIVWKGNNITQLILCNEKVEHLWSSYWCPMPTDDNEIQDEEGVKSVAPPPTAHTDEATVACLVADCSLWQYNWRHRGDF